MSLDPDRLQAAVSALFGGLFFALVHLATALLNGQSPGVRDIILALANVLCAITGGIMASWFLAPAVAGLIPDAMASLRDLHAVGFGVGGLAWVLAPFLIKWVEAKAAQKVEGLGQ